VQHCGRDIAVVDTRRDIARSSSMARAVEAMRVVLDTSLV